MNRQAPTHRALTFSSPGTVGHDEEMTVIKINAITVPADSGDELAHRFAARAGAVDNADGFEGFELLKPTDGREQWLVVTRWRDEESFQAWLNSDSFAHGHRSTAERRGQARRHRSPPIARSGLTYPLVDPVPADRRSAQR
jgi:heme oxygenase (mycobilin-producing)